ncbi:hypothetical protein F4821DRAFT_274975 [Hypoxylon rubiginosum]|uniref:Uncharacterized protein n=1 Tax=Hypoxylon rubiginosum TaxID=110542 RepID=A0ACC0CLV8_9PEZI|nr:hypothetical protein F4821DRAFT_274975 [Hypoxylon rubiginosum]
MNSSAELPKPARRNSLITLMCEIEGIEPPEEDAYESGPPSPLTDEQLSIIFKIIRSREGAQESSSSKDEPALDTKSPRYRCPKCNLGLKTIRTLKQHVGDVHIGTECFWPGCTTSVSTEVELNKHLKWHNDAAAVGIENGQLTCNWPGCGNPYKNADSVARHLRKHTTTARTAAS